MRNPDRTYITLYDRAVYMLTNQIDSVNYHRKHSRTAIDPRMQQSHINQMFRQLDIFTGMTELFEATFRDYKIGVELMETPTGDIYNYWIEAR